MYDVCCMYRYVRMCVCTGMYVCMYWMYILHIFRNYIMFQNPIVYLFILHYKDYADQHLFSLLFSNSFSEYYIIHHLKQVAIQSVTHYCNQSPTNLPRTCFGASNIILTPHNPFVSFSVTTVLFYFVITSPTTIVIIAIMYVIHSICIR